MVCPQCGRPILPEEIRAGACFKCQQHFSVAPAYFRKLGAITLGTVVLLGLLSLSRSARGSWFLWLFLFGIVLRLTLGFLVPPWFDKGFKQPKVTFTTVWILWAIILCIYYLDIGGLFSGVGATRDFREHMESLSYPLGYLNPRFLITAQTAGIDLVGITLANSCFYAALIAACFTFVRWVFRRNRVTQIGLGQTSPEDDED